MEFPIRVAWRGHARFALMAVLMPVLLFGCAGRLDWVMGWLYVGILLAVTSVTRLVTLRVSPDLLAEREASFRRADLKSWDKTLIPLLVGICPVAMWIIAGLSTRFLWQPRVPVVSQQIALFAIFMGSVFTAWAMVVNRFFSAVVRIQRERGHSVVSTGPYGVVRHPGYAGTVIFNLGTPLVLDAFWAFIPALVVVVSLVVRTALEDQTLLDELDGYAEYAERTPFRLVPWLW